MKIPFCLLIWIVQSSGRLIVLNYWLCMAQYTKVDNIRIIFRKCTPLPFAAVSATTDCSSHSVMSGRIFMFLSKWITKTLMEEYIYVEYPKETTINRALNM